MEACLAVALCCASVLMLSCSWWILKSVPRPRSTGLADAREDGDARLPALERLARRVRGARGPKPLETTSKKWINPRA